MNDRQNKKTTWLAKNILSLGLVSLFTDLSTEMAYPIIPVFLREVLKVQPLFIGLIEAIAESTASILKTFSGYISDRLKKRKLFIFSNTFLPLEVRVLSDYKQLHLSGRDMERITPGELMLHVEEVAPRVKGDSYALALAATPGWSDQAIERIKQVGSLYPNLRVVLIDLKDKEMQYEHDDKLERILPYLKPKS